VLSTLDGYKNTVVCHADTIASSLDSQLISASEKVKSMILSESSTLFTDFIRLSYSKENDVLRVVMRWIYETCKPNGEEGYSLPEKQFFYECFKNDQNYEDELYKRFIFSFWEHSQEHWKVNAEKTEEGVIKMAMKITACAMAETKLENLLDKSHNEVADSLFDIFTESFESTDRMDTKDFLKRFKHENSIQEVNNEVKTIVEMYHNVGESLCYFVDISKTSNFVRFFCFVKDCVQYQFAQTKRIIVLTKDTVVKGSQLVIKYSENAYETAYLFAELKIQYVTIKLVESKDFMKLQLKSLIDNEYAQQMKQFIADNYKLVSLKYDSIKELLESQKLELVKYLLKNKALLRQIIDANAEKLVSQYNNYREEHVTLQNVHEFVISTLQNVQESVISTLPKVIEMMDDLSDKANQAKNYTVNKCSEARDLAADNYTTIKMAAMIHYDKASIVVNENYGNAKVYLGAKYEATSEFAQEKYGSAKKMTLEQAEQLRLRAENVYAVLIEYLTNMFDSNKIRLIEFVTEYHLQEKISPIYDRALSCYSSSRDSLVEIYENTRELTPQKVVSKIIHNEYAEQVQARVNQLVGTFYEYVNVKSKEYKNVDTLRDFFLYENSLIYLHSVCH
jgi:hypothetical protein